MVNLISILFYFVNHCIQTSFVSKSIVGFFWLNLIFDPKLCLLIQNWFMVQNYFLSFESNLFSLQNWLLNHWLKIDLWSQILLVPKLVFKSKNQVLNRNWVLTKKLIKKIMFASKINLNQTRFIFRVDIWSKNQMWLWVQQLLFDPKVNFDSKS